MVTISIQIVETDLNSSKQLPKFKKFKTFNSKNNDANKN